MILSTLKGLNKNFVRVAVSLLIWGIGEGMFFVFQSLYLQELGADPVAIGAILSGVGIAMSLSFIPAGYLSDRYGPRPVMLSSWGIALVATVIMAFAPSLPVFIAGTILYGLTGFVTAPMMAYVSQMRGNLEVARALTLTSAGFQTGMIIGPTLGGIIASRFGLIMNYRAAILIFIVSSLVIFSIESLPPVKHQEAEVQETIWNNRRYLVFLALFFLTIVILYLPQPLTPNYLQNQKAVDIEMFGRLASIGGLGVVVFSLVFGGLQPATGFLIGQACVSLFAFSMWKGDSPFLFSLGYFFIGGYRLSATMSMAMVRSMVRSSQVGLAFGVMATAQSVAIVVSPLMAGFIYNVRPDMIFRITLVGIAVMFLGNFLILPRLRKAQSLLIDGANEPLNSDLHTGTP